MFSYVAGKRALSAMFFFVLSAVNMLNTQISGVYQITCICEKHVSDTLA